MDCTVTIVSASVNTTSRAWLDDLFTITRWLALFIPAFRRSSTLRYKHIIKPETLSSNATFHFIRQLMNIIILCLTFLCLFSSSNWWILQISILQFEADYFVMLSVELHLILHVIKGVVDSLDSLFDVPLHPVNHWKVCQGIHEHDRGPEINAEHSGMSVISILKYFHWKYLLLKKIEIPVNL